MKDRQTERNRAGVPQEATQAGEIRDRWSWVEACVWTDRMLTALEEGERRQVVNAFSAEQGLFSLTAAYAAACQSSRRGTTDRRAVCGRTARTVRRGEGPGT